VNEHSAIIAALRQGDVRKAVSLMDEHIGSVERRALLADLQAAESNLGSVLSRYSGAVEAHRKLTSLSAASKRKKVAR
jgi:hypothetical protein